MVRVLRSFYLFLLVAVFLSSCSARSYQAFLKPGATAKTVSRDRASCDVESNRLFPAANFPNTYPYGTIGYYGGGWGYGIGVVSTTDVNANMRNQHRTQCMRLKGYEPYSFSVCTQEQLGGRSYAPLTKSPDPSANLCFVRLEGGGRALINLDEPI